MSFKLTDDPNADIQNLLKRNAELEEVVSYSLRILDGLDNNYLFPYNLRPALNVIKRLKEVDNNTE